MLRRTVGAAGGSGTTFRIPRVAVIIPCWNDGATVLDAVASIEREPTDLELVVVDDGSTDPATIGELARLEVSGVRVIRQANEGPSAAAMHGLRATSAPFVMRFDADDLLEPGALDALADALDRSPEAAVAWGDFQTFGRTTFLVPTPPTLDPWLLTYVNCVPGAGCLFRRAAVESAGGWQLRDGFEDWDLWLSFAELDLDGVRVPCVAFRYRRQERGRQAEAVSRTRVHYDELRHRHAALFARRRESRRRSGAPLALRLAVGGIEALPWLSRLTRIRLCEMFTHLFWNGGLRVTARMVWQAGAARLPRGGQG